MINFMPILMLSDWKDRKGRFPIHYSTGCVPDVDTFLYRQSDA